MRLLVILRCWLLIFHSVIGQTTQSQPSLTQVAAGLLWRAGAHDNITGKAPYAEASDTESIAILDVAAGGISAPANDQAVNIRDELLGAQAQADLRSKHAFNPDATLLQMQLPDITLQELHSSAPHQSLVEFLAVFHDIVCNVTGVQKYRLNILGIHGFYQRDKGPYNVFHVTSLDADETLPKTHNGEQVVIRFAVSPARDSNDVDGLKALNALESQLKNPNSKLMISPLQGILKDATVYPTPRKSHVGDADQRRSVLSAMALPFGVSALFTGILISFAAW